MKKRILAALLAASMALCAGCGSQTSDDGEEQTAAGTAVEVAEVTKGAMSTEYSVNGTNCPPDTVPDFVTLAVRISIHQGWYPNVGSSQTSVQLSKPPTYPVRNVSKPNVRLQ